MTAPEIRCLFCARVIARDHEGRIPTSEGGHVVGPRVTIVCPGCGAARTWRRPPRGRQKLDIRT